MKTSLVGEATRIAANARRIVAELSERFPSRNGLNPPALHGAAHYVECQFRALGLETVSQEYITHDVPVRNIAVVKQGSDPDAASLVVGAHYDSVIGTPGADDNASGVAALIELARLLKEFPNRRTIHLVAFTHEEPPYFYTRQMGSRRYARHLRKGNENVLVMLSLEMLGYASETMKQLYPFPLLRLLGRYPRFGNYIALVGNLRSQGMVRRITTEMRKSTSIGIERLSAPGFLPPLFLSDHSSFWRNGYRAVMVTDTAFLRNPNYHTPDDTAEKLNYGFLAEVVLGLCDALLMLDSHRGRGRSRPN